MAWEDILKLENMFDEISTEGHARSIFGTLLQQESFRYSLEVNQKYDKSTDNSYLSDMQISKKPKIFVKLSLSNKNKFPIFARDIIREPRNYNFVMTYQLVKDGKVQEKEIELVNA